MNCPRLSNLPPPPPGKTGWPWTEESPPLPATMPDGTPWPTISIVTPSYNQGQFIEETLRSVLLQGYPNLEYIVIDGGSTDESVDIIERYAPWLTYWVSEPDRGQTHAINKGFALTTGKVMAWLNSDDLYLPNALPTIVKHLTTGTNSWLFGACEVRTEKGRRVKIPRIPETRIDWVFRRITSHLFFAQPSVAWTIDLWNRVSPIDANLHYSFDLDLFIRMMNEAGKPTIVLEALSVSRIHDDCKTSSQSSEFIIEELAIAKRYQHLWKNRSEGKELYHKLRKLASRTQLARSRAWTHESRKWRTREIVASVITYPPVITHPLFWKSLLDLITWDKSHFKNWSWLNPK